MYIYPVEGQRKKLITSGLDEVALERKERKGRIWVTRGKGTSSKGNGVNRSG